MTDNGSETLTLRPTFIGAGRDDDYQVIWCGLPVGRIMKISGATSGGPLWWMHPTRQTFDRRDYGTCDSLDDCETEFTVAWDGIRSGLTDADIAKAYRYTASLP